MTEHHRPAGWKNRNLFTRSPGGPSSESGLLGPKRDAGRAPLRPELPGEKPCPTPPAPGSASAPRGLPASLVRACRARQPQPPASRAPPLPQGPGDPAGAGPGWPPGPPSDAGDAGTGAPRRTSAGPLLCSEAGSTPGERGRGQGAPSPAGSGRAGLAQGRPGRPAAGRMPPDTLSVNGPCARACEASPAAGGSLPRLGQG